MKEGRGRARVSEGKKILLGEHILAKGYHNVVGGLSRE